MTNDALLNGKVVTLSDAEREMLLVTIEITNIGC